MEKKEIIGTKTSSNKKIKKTEIDEVVEACLFLCTDAGFVRSSQGQEK